MSLLHLTFDRETQIYLVGFFGAVMTIWPVLMLIMLPHDVFIAKHVLTAKHNARLAQLEKENQELFLELMDHKAIIDELLKEKFYG